MEKLHQLLSEAPRKTQTVQMTEENIRQKQNTAENTEEGFREPLLEDDSIAP